jgi:crotonobetainyl-CoA:carnitine CoA-transferase CaiB-like acyl-CoA transferase
MSSQPSSAANAGVREAARGLLVSVGLPASSADGLSICGNDPVYPSPFRFGEAAAAVLGATGAAASLLWEAHTGRPQGVAVDVRRAAASLSGPLLVELDGSPAFASYLDIPGSGIFECRDGRYIQLRSSLPNIVQAVLGVLRCSYTRDGMAAAIREWGSFELEEALNAGGACAAVIRSAGEWRSSPQGSALAAVPLVRIERIASSDPEPLSTRSYPLDAVRVLDLTRMLAGPLVGRLLGEYGADVLLINSPHIIQTLVPTLEGHPGKRSGFLDLRIPAQAARLRKLVEESDIFVNSYRHGALEGLGFGADDVAAVRPGIIYVSETCYGNVGPWRARRGFDHMGQAVSGLLHGHHVAVGRVEELPPLAPIDYVTGYLGALGALAALWQRAHEGGSFHVSVSLARTAMWIEENWQGADPASASGLGDVRAWLTESDTRWGRLTQPSPVVELTETPPRWRAPVVPVGTDRPEWI